MDPTTFQLVRLVDLAQKTVKWMQKQIKKNNVTPADLRTRKKYKKLRKQYKTVADQSRKIVLCSITGTYLYIPAFKGFTMWILRNSLSKEISAIHVYEAYTKKRGIKNGGN